MSFGLVLGILGVVLGAAGIVAAWNLGARSERRITDQVSATSSATAAAISTELSRLIPAATVLPHAEGPAPPPGVPAFVGYRNACDEGAVELLIQHPTGAHATALKVLGKPMGSSELKTRAELSSPPGATFQVADFDNDARTEVATLVYDDGYPERSLSVKPLQVIAYRWDGARFVEAWRGESFDPQSNEPPPLAVSRFLVAPEWALALRAEPTS